MKNEVSLGSLRTEKLLSESLKNYSDTWEASICQMYNNIQDFGVRK